MRLFALFLCCLLLAGCAGAPASPAVSTTELPTASETHPSEILTVFLPNDNADAFVKTEVEVQEITKEVIVAQLVKAGVLSDGTTVNTLEIDEDSGLLKADFNAPFRQVLQTMGTSGEYMIMGSVINTFLSTFDVDSMTITVDGSILETGHSVYDQPLSFYPDNT